MKSKKQENQMSEKSNQELDDLKVTDEGSQQTKGGHGTHVAGTIGSDPWGVARG